MNFEGNWDELRTKYVRAGNPGQNVWNKVEKIKQNSTGAENFDNHSCIVSNHYDKMFYFWNEDWELGSISTQFWQCPNISQFPKVLNRLRTIYQVPLYLWWIQFLLKCCKVPRYHVQDYRINAFSKTLTKIFWMRPIVFKNLKRSIKFYLKLKVIHTSFLQILRCIKLVWFICLYYHNLS